MTAPLIYVECDLRPGQSLREWRCEHDGHQADTRHRHRLLRRLHAVRHPHRAPSGR